MTYGTIKVDTVTFTDAGVDKSVTLSGLVQNPTFSGNVTVTGTLSGVTVTGTTANFTSGNFTNISGGTHTITSGVFASGTAANPSISFVSDPNSGLYSPGADQVAISTNGTGRLFVDASGNVGVGVSPAAKLHVYGTYGYFQDGTYDGYFGKGNGVVVGAAASDLGISSSTGSIVFGTGASLNERMRLDTSGRLGLGTSSPAEILHLGGSSAQNIRINGNTNAMYLGTVGDTTQVAVNRRPTDGTIPNSARGTAFINVNGLSTGGSIELATSTAANTGATTAVTIDSSQRVGIGTTSPARALDVNGSIQLPSNNALYINGSNNYLYADTTTTELASATSIKFVANSAERARIDSSGRLLVGTSTARDPAGEAKIEAFNGPIAVSTYADSAGFYGLNFVKSRGTSTNVIVQNNDSLAGARFFGADGTSFLEAARIEAYVDGTPGTDDMPGRLVFFVTADGASSPTERMRIAANGTVYINRTSAVGGFGSYLNITHSGGAWYGIMLQNDSTNNSNAVSFINASNVEVGKIEVTSSATSYVTTSDYRLKENISPLTGAIDRVNQLKAHRFNFLAAPDKTVDGFIAHEAQAVVPECVTGTKDEVDDDGNPVYQGIDQSKLVPLLTAALQEALTKIETLEAKVAALEAQ